MIISNRPASFTTHLSLQAALNPLPKIGRLYLIIAAVLNSPARYVQATNVGNLRGSYAKPLLNSTKSHFRGSATQPYLNSSRRLATPKPTVIPVVDGFIQMDESGKLIYRGNDGTVVELSLKKGNGDTLNPVEVFQDLSFEPGNYFGAKDSTENLVYVFQLNQNGSTDLKAVMYALNCENQQLNQIGLTVNQNPAFACITGDVQFPESRSSGLFTGIMCEKFGNKPNVNSMAAVGDFNTIMSESNKISFYYIPGRKGYSSQIARNLYDRYSEITFELMSAPWDESWQDSQDCINLGNKYSRSFYYPPGYHSIAARVVNSSNGYAQHELVYVTNTSSYELWERHDGARDYAYLSFTTIEGNFEYHFTQEAMYFYYPNNNNTVYRIGDDQESTMMTNVPISNRNFSVSNGYISTGAKNVRFIPDTPAPTPVPTIVPTLNLTPSPTNAQTPAPSIQTKAPTSITTTQPTEISTEIPTPPPTIQPNEPTITPTQLPTQSTNAPTPIPATPQPTIAAEPILETEKTTPVDQIIGWTLGAAATLLIALFTKVGRMTLNHILLFAFSRPDRNATLQILQRKHNSKERKQEFENLIRFYNDTVNNYQPLTRSSFLEALIANNAMNQIFDPNSTTGKRLIAYFTALHNHLQNDLLSLDTNPDEFISLNFTRRIRDSCHSSMRGNQTPPQLSTHEQRTRDDKIIIAKQIQDVLFPKLPNNGSRIQMRDQAKVAPQLRKMLEITATKLALASIPQLIAEEQRSNPSFLNKLSNGQKRIETHYNAKVNYERADQNLNPNAIHFRAEASAQALAREDFFQIIKVLKIFSDDARNMNNLTSQIGGDPADSSHPIYKKKIYVLSDMMASVVLNQTKERLQAVLNIPSYSSTTIKIQPPHELSSLPGFSRNQMNGLTTTLSTSDNPSTIPLPNWNNVTNFLKQP
ncbi:MAG: hypothetical protein V4629_05880 [Pseudomonadota bacterium]